MLSSKANAALTRVKEIEEKYKMKRREQRWNRKEVSILEIKQCICASGILFSVVCHTQFVTA